ncbi:hypothetical protein K490DRAFT_64799 [Saccharata proteae CBS 121410]|uniref:Uncharacterized protein n=1 Tax=Saccharata proteae CBS 121410 TaxID=1314787 RepID=A0A9P4LW38_9PEZI|nr:hypothetical protein K490DRAFT_64799 [Saccharata proteae CBS 121410]
MEFNLINNQLAGCYGRCDEVQEFFTCGCIYLLPRPCRHLYDPEQQPKHPVPRGHNFACGGNNICVAHIIFYRAAWFQEAEQARDRARDAFTHFGKRVKRRWAGRKVDTRNEERRLQAGFREAKAEALDQRRAYYHWIKDPRRVLHRAGRAGGDMMDVMRHNFQQQVQERHPVTYNETGHPLEKTYRAPPSPTDLWVYEGFFDENAEPFPLVPSAIAPAVEAAQNNLFFVPNDNQDANQNLLPASPPAAQPGQEQKWAAKDEAGQIDFGHADPVAHNEVIPEQDHAEQLPADDFFPRELHEDDFRQLDDDFSTLFPGYTPASSTMNSGEAVAESAPEGEDDADPSTSGNDGSVGNDSVQDGPWVLFTMMSPPHQPGT